MRIPALGLLSFAAALALAAPARAQQEPQGDADAPQRPAGVPPPNRAPYFKPRPGVPDAEPDDTPRRLKPLVPARKPPAAAPAQPYKNAIAPKMPAPAPPAPGATRATEPPATAPVDKKEIH